MSGFETPAFNWNEAEEAIAVILLPKLQDLRDLAVRSDALVERSLEGVKQSGKTFSPSAQVHTRLLLRLAQDLRATVLLVTRGHVLQALTVAATILEQAHELGYIGGDDDRAKKWLSHSAERRSYPATVSEAISATAQALQSPELEISGKSFYQKLCMAKHANPVLQREFGVKMEPGAMRIARGPFISPYSVALSRWCLNLSIRYVLLAVLLFSRFRMRADSARNTATEMEAIHEALAAASAHSKNEMNEVLQALEDPRATPL